MGLDSGWMWLVVLAIGLVLGGLIGAFQGVIVAYVGVPSFIVTLGGLLVWRGFAWLTASGRTIAPMDATFQLLGGGARGIARRNRELDRRRDRLSRNHRASGQRSASPSEVRLPAPPDVAGRNPRGLRLRRRTRRRLGHQ